MTDVSSRSIDPSRQCWKAFENGVGDLLTEKDLAALLLRTGGCGSGHGVHVMAEALLKAHGGLAGLDRASPGELLKIRGMGSAKVLTLKAAFEAGRRLAAGAEKRGRRFTSSREVAEQVGPRLVQRRRERFLAILLNGRHELIREFTVSIGSLTSSIVHPREAFLPAVRESAAAIIFVHNHPSGDPTPSDEDRRLTDRLLEAGAILGIRVLDHVIVARRGYVSLMDGQPQSTSPAPWTGS